MPWDVIHKRIAPEEPSPHLADYEAARAGFTWQAARAELDGLPDGAGLNIAHEALDRHVAAGRGERVALRWIAKDGSLRDASYGQMSALTNRFANALAGLGVGPGGRVFALAGRIPELYVAALGTVRHRSVFCPLFAAFGPEPIRARMAAGAAKVLVTTEALYRRKIAPIRDSLPTLEHVLLVGAKGRPESKPTPGVQDFHAFLEAAAPDYTIGPTDPEDMARLHALYGNRPAPHARIGCPSTLSGTVMDRTPTREIRRLREPSRAGPS